jgi:hypothetical protein
MIAVKGSASDYAIMKQVQQLKLRNPEMAIVPLDEQTSFSELGQDELLYLLAHGNAANGDFRAVASTLVLEWLSREVGGVPMAFGGIIILSCFSGRAYGKYGEEPSLASFFATGLRNHAAQGTKVEGADGYSFGTRELRETGRSSVLHEGLAGFYLAEKLELMVQQWLNHKPTHTGGVLAEKLTINVDTEKSIAANLQAAETLTQSPEEIVTEYVKSFAQESTQIVRELDTIINKVPGDTVAARAGFLVNSDNSNDERVTGWNAAIERQYTLFHDYYLWAPPEKAFTSALVG